jgi:hypothetical protein
MGQLTRAHLARRLAARADAKKAESFDPARLLHPKQAHAVRFDPEKRRRAIVAGRRGGKTYGIDVSDLDVASRLGWPVLYITLTRINAKELVWDDLLRLNKDYALGGDVSVSELQITWPNGGKIALAGCNNEREIQKARGKFWRRVKVDECQSIPDRILVPLLGPILSPTLLDYGGELWCSGSRPPVRAGHWFRITEGDLAGNYEQHRFDIRDNDRLPARREGRSIVDILEEFRKDQGWAEDDPTYLREVLNMDVQDLEALLFALREESLIDQVPEGFWTYVFGIDIGSVDADAIAVWGWRRHDSGLYLVDEFELPDQDVTDLAETIKRYQAVFHPISMVIDEGGGGKKSVEELRRRWGLPLKAAEKSQKPAYIRLFNADLRKGIAKVSRKCKSFIEDCRLVRKDPEALARNVLQELPAKKGGYHSDICDGALYGWREAYHWLEQAAPAPPANEHQATLERLYAAQHRVSDPLAQMLGMDD